MSKPTRRKPAQYPDSASAGFVGTVNPSNEIVLEAKINLAINLKENDRFQENVAWLLEQHAAFLRETANAPTKGNESYDYGNRAISWDVKITRNKRPI